MAYSPLPYASVDNSMLYPDGSTGGNEYVHGTLVGVGVGEGVGVGVAWGSAVGVGVGEGVGVGVGVGTRVICDPGGLSTLSSFICTYVLVMGSFPAIALHTMRTLDTCMGTDMKCTGPGAASDALEYIVVQPDSEDKRPRTCHVRRDAKEASVRISTACA